MKQQWSCGRRGDALRRAGGAFERWRRGRKPGHRIPGTLWQVAVEAAREHGVSRTSRALGLEYYALKKRLDPSVDPAPAAEFVEVPLGALGAVPECVLELEDGQGARLRVELKGPATRDLAAVARALWSVAG